jgi:multiple sugar transport system substrate-binding protein
MSRLLRRTPIVALALALGLVMAACTSKKAEEGPTQNPTALSGQIKVIMEEVPDTDVVSAMLADFNSEYPDIQVTIEAMPYDQMRDRLVSSFLASEPTYDMIIVDNPWMYDFARGGFLEPLDGYIDGTEGFDYADFSAPLRDIAEVDGKTYGVPFYNYGLGLIYRTDLYEQAGLTPPTSLDEFVADAQQLTTPDRAGLAMQPQKGYKIFEEEGNYLFAAGGAIQDEAGNVVLDSPEARNALETYIELYKTAAPKNSLNWAFDESLRAVAGDGAAQMISYNWMLPTLNNPDGPAGDLAGKFALAEVPGGKAILGAWYWSIPANSTQKDAAWAFISWLMSKEHDKERVIAGGAPVRESVMNDPEVWDQGFGEDYYKTVLAILEDAAPLADGPNAEEMIQVVGEELSAAVAGQKSVDEAITAAAQRAQEVLNK